MILIEVTTFPQQRKSYVLAKNPTAILAHTKLGTCLRINGHLRKIISMREVTDDELESRKLTFTNLSRALTAIQISGYETFRVRVI